MRFNARASGSKLLYERVVGSGEAVERYLEAFITFPELLGAWSKFDLGRGNKSKTVTSLLSFLRISEECRAMKVSRMIPDIWSTSHACVQYESCTDANVRFWFYKRCSKKKILEEV